jgi:hypothetical protein
MVWHWEARGSAPDILYLIKKAEKRISSLYESNKQKIY